MACAVIIRWMHNVAAVTFLFLAVVLGMGSGCSDATARDPAPGDNGGSGAAGSPVAVVELFTSEGCSSCPPADALLASLADDAQSAGKPVYLLSFHVDYWDRLGWSDPYADAAHTRRQRRYAQHFAARNVYTPQMIVNGSAEFVGSNRAKATHEIEQALKRKSAVAVTLKKPSRSGEEVTVEYTVSPVPEKSLLHVAVVERELITKVPRGENAGRTLRHDNVVRRFQTIELSGAEVGKVEFKLPPSLRPERSSVIAYVQDAGNLTVLGATSVNLDGASTRPASAAQ